MALGTTNISIQLLKDTLSASVNNVSALCTHPNINMWSKRKPVNDPRISIPESEVGMGGGIESPAPGWGLQLPNWAGDDTLLTTYIRPVGGVNGPYRMGDFRGYAHDAQNPVFTGPEPGYLRASNEWIIIGIANQNGESVSIYDLYSSLIRPGVQVYENGIPFNAASAQDGQSVVELDLSGLANSYLTFKFGLVDYYKPWSNVGGLNFLYELPRAALGENLNWTDIQIISETAEAPGGGDSITTYYVTSNHVFINDGVAGTGYLYITHSDDRLDRTHRLIGESVDIQFRANFFHLGSSTSLLTVNYLESDFRYYDVNSPLSPYGYINESPSYQFDEQRDYECVVEFYNTNNNEWQWFGSYNFTTFIDPNSGSVF